MMDMDRKTFTEYVCGKFLESQDMADYILNRDITPDHCFADLYDIIISSRAALEQKAEALETLSALGMEDVEYDWGFGMHGGGRSPGMLAREARRALAQTEDSPPDSVFLVKQYYRDFESRDPGGYDKVMESTCPPFTSFTAASAYIQRLAFEELDGEGEPSDDGNGWNTVERWDMTEDRDFVLTVAWELSNTGRIWGYRREGDGRDKRSLVPSRHDLDLSTPFQIGDIIVIDLRPFQDIALGVILYAEHQYDCCSPQCAIITKRYAYGRSEPTTHVCTAALKHWPRVWPKFSPLLRARYAKADDISAFTSHAPSLYPAILSLSERIKRNPSLAEQYHEFFWRHDSIEI